MKRSFLSCLTVSALLIAAPFSSANAADLPVKGAPYAPAPIPVASWTGCYIGGNVGEAWVEKNNIILEQVYQIPGNTPLNTASGSGLAYGGQVGCDYQVNSAWVIGIRGMWDGTNVKGSASGYNTDLEGTTFNFTSNSYATAVARVGYLLNATMMLYGLGGVASVHDQYSLYSPENGGLIANGSETRTGYALGAGMSWMFIPNWDVFIEYDYMNFGSRTVGLAGTGTYQDFSAPLSFNQTVQTIFVGLDWRFSGAR